MRSVASAALLVPAVAGPLGNQNGLNRLPLMGWNTWSTQGKTERDYCDENEVKGVAIALQQSGLQDIGFKHVALDDCWGFPNRTADGHLQADPSRFPKGIKELADWLHARNFTMGIYTSLGYTTCSMAEHKAHLPGSWGSFALDAGTFASWGMDAVKGDWCDARGLDQQNTSTWFGNELNATGRPMWYNFHCSGSWADWCAVVGDSSRVHADHFDCWESCVPGHAVGTIDAIEALGGAGAHAGLQPDGETIWWPDWDFLQTGGAGCNDTVTPHCPGMTDVEYRSEFAFWSLASSPLIFATDPRDLTPIMKEVLFNTELIAVNQDPHTRPAMGLVRVSQFACAYASPLPKQCELWHRPPGPDGAHYVVVFNPNDLASGPASGPNVTVSFDFTALGLPSGTSATVRDLWAHKDIGTFTGAYAAPAVQPHEGRPLKLTIQ